MDNQPILSLCIPTNGAVEWILPAIDSIYSQGYDNSKFEVVITDNGVDSELPQQIKKLHYPNLRYIQTKEEGFKNLVNCLKEGKGIFCKMINHRSRMIPGSISEIIDCVEHYKSTQPIIYCFNGNKFLKNGITDCPNIDSLIQNLSYWCSLSAGIGFWQKDVETISKIETNPMFPNSSLLFDVRKDTRYVIWNQKYQIMGNDDGKGGYDVFNTFSVIFIDIINDLRKDGRISNKTFLKFKNDLFDFLCVIYAKEVLLPTNHTFIIKDICNSISIYYGPVYYVKLLIVAFFKSVIMRLKKIKFISRHN